MVYRFFFVTVFATAVLVADTTPAQAYIGPGAGLGAIGTVLALLLAILLAIVGFIWYPVKRMLKKRKQQDPVVKD